MNSSSPTPLRRVLLLATLAILPSSPTQAQQLVTDIPGLTAKGKREMPPVPDLTKGGKPDDKHDWNLGPTGARGWMWAMRLRTDIARQILVTKVGGMVRWRPWH